MMLPSQLLNWPAGAEWCGAANIHINRRDRNIAIQYRNIDIDDRYMNISDRDIDIMYENIDAIVQT